jgi:hypothetical protein
MQQPGRHQVRVRIAGEVDPAWSAILSGIEVVPAPDGSTLLVGELTDQAAVHGLLATIRDLGLSLLSVETTTSPKPEAAGGAGGPGPGPVHPADR